MKSVVAIIILFALVLCVSCEVKNDEAQKLFISIDETQVFIESNTSESIVVSSKSEKQFYLTRQEKQKIFSLAEKALKRKSYTIKTKTDFAGHRFKIELIKMNDTLKIANVSVDNWTDIHPEFKEIKNVLSKKNVFLK